MKRFLVLAVIASLSGCASWCNNSDDQQKCLNRVHAAQVVGAGIAIVAVAVVAAKGSRQPSYDDNCYRGNCQHTWQFAKDGSRCGNRAADYRPGGY